MIDFNEYVLGESKEKLLVETMEENRHAAVALATQASRSLHIFSLDLEPIVYDNHEFVEAVKNLAITHSKAQIQIIIQDSRKLIDHGHRIIELARRLSSSIHIRKTPPDMKKHTQAFLIADETGILHRTIGERYEGYVNFNDRFEAKNILDFFKITWEHCVADPELRRLHI